jgi:hypothetical protein
VIGKGVFFSQSVRFFVQNPRFGGHFRANCTILRTKSAVQRPFPGKLYDSSYKIRNSAAFSGQTVRFFVQNPRFGGHFQANCTILRTKSAVQRPFPGKLYDSSYKIRGSLAFSGQTVRFFVQKRGGGGRKTEDRVGPDPANYRSGLRNDPFVQHPEPGRQHKPSFWPG